MCLQRQLEETEERGVTNAFFCEGIGDRMPESEGRVRAERRGRGRLVRDAIEARFERLGRWIVRNHRAWVGVVVLFAALPMLPLGELELDTSSRGFLRDDDPTQQRYEAFREAFGRDALLLVDLEAPDVLTPAALETLVALHARLEAEVPRLESVTSLRNAPSMLRGEGGTLLVRPLEREFPQPGDATALAAFRERVLADPMLSGLLVSEDARHALVVLKSDAFSAHAGDGEPSFITPEEDAEIVAAVRTVLDDQVAAPYAARLVGAPLVALELQTAMRRDMLRLSVLSLLISVALLALLFRRAPGVYIPIAVVTLAAGATLGTMAWTGTPVRAPTQILPSFVLAVGVCGVLHLLVAFFRHYDSGDEVEDAVGAAFRHAGLPIALTGLTTIAGLLSFRSAALAPIAEFGLFAPIGILYATGFTFLLTPALLAMAPLRQRPERRERGLSARLLATLGRLSARSPRAVVGFATVALVVSVVGIAKIRLSHDPLSWFPSDHPLRTSAETVDAKFHGLMSLELIVRAESRRGFSDPDLFAGIHAFEWAARGLEIGGTRAGHVFSPVDLLERVHRTLDPEDPAPLPTRRGTLVRNAMLWDQAALSGGGGWMAEDGRAMRVSVRLPWEDAVHYPEWIAGIEDAAAATVGPHAEVEVTGATAVMSRVVNAVLQSLANSYVLALLLITPMIGFTVGNWRAGAIAMIPNLTPIAATLGLMGWLGIPLDVFTLLVGCIAIGLAVDDTIHFMHGFERAYAREGDVGEAVSITLQSTGRALLFTSLVLATSFLGYALSPLAHIGNFGWLMATAMTLAFGALIVLAPALLTLFRTGTRTPAAEPVAEEIEPALRDTLRESAEALGCAPAWLEAGTLPAFSYLERGERGPTLVLLHGLFGAVSNWDAVIPNLAKFSRVIALDFPLLAGARSEITVQALAVYTEAFLRVQELRDVTLCGNSLGGHVALRLALQAPELVRSLVLTGSSGLYEHEPARMPLRPDADFVRDQMHRVFHRDEFVTDEGIAEVVGIFSKRSKAFNIIQAARSAKLDNMQDCLGEIAPPTLLLWGEQDQVTPMDVARSFEDLLPQATLESVDRCGHAPMIEEPEWFADRVAAFLGVDAKEDDGEAA